jgi:ABC-type nitrate/sulfonate/bicarbonate transport system substrate-binding protein
MGKIGYSMGRNMKKIILVLVMMTMVFSGCAAKKKSKVTLVLDWTPNTNHTGFFVAKELGFYEKQGLTVEIIQPPEGGALSLLAGNKAEFAVSFQEELMTAINAEQPLPVVAVAGLLAHNTGGILSLKEKNITSFKDLEGKNYGSWSIPIYDEILSDTVKTSGGDPAKIKMVPNNATDTITGIQKEFDATWVYEGWDKVIADTKGIETNFISFKDVNPVFDYYTPILVTSEKYTTENKSNLIKFLKATKEGYEYAVKNPDKSAEILLKESPEIGADVAIKSQQFLKDKYFDKAWGIIDDTRWSNFNNWMQSKGLIKLDEQKKGYTNEYIK